MDENQIKEEAKNIMDNFMQALDKIEVEDEFNLIREQTFRLEEIKKDKKSELNNDFQNAFLENAPRLSGSAILANKGEWVKNE